MEGREKLPVADTEIPLPRANLPDEAAVGAVHSIDIAADREIVFDFLAQMGFGRAGWYSYDWIDNLGRKSATTIHPEWIVATAGETVPAGPIDFVAAVVDRPTSYVLALPSQQSLGYTTDFVLAYRLDETTGGTRLTARTKVAIDGPGGSLLAGALLLADGVMVRRQLRGLRDRVNKLSASE